MHDPLHVDAVFPVELPYEPAAHLPLHADVVRFADEPYVPAGHAALCVPPVQ